MDAIRIKIDTGVFSSDVIARAAHRYTGDYFVDLALSSDQVVLTPKHAGVDTSQVAARFHNDLLDERLRTRIRDETADLQATLVQAALREASPRDTGAAP